ncbi:MAG: dephospho-CoA kinase [Pseudomonadales bacterium]
MFVVGVTGGIGSGKTAVTDRFSQLGITIVDADLASRVIVEPGRTALIKIAEHFGDDILLESGELNRAELRSRIFSEPTEREWLEQLTHPLIGEEIARQLENSTSPYTIFVSPLLIETTQAQLTHRILLVDVPVEVQIARTMQRDDNSEEQVRAIIASQASREERHAKTDDIILNDQGLDWLDQEVARLHKLYLKLARESAH